jgi:hypothetical protein
MKYILWTALNRSGYGRVAGSCEHGHERMSSIESREFLTWQKIPKKDYGPWKYLIEMSGETEIDGKVCSSVFSK